MTSNKDKMKQEMKIKPIPKELMQLGDEKGFELVELADDTNIGRLTPHCKIHRAMNKMEQHNIWRCLSEYGRELKEGNSLPTFKDRTCIACCQEEDLI
jgi:hypothetical protein